MDSFIWIGDFRVAFRLCFKASPSAKPFIWKLVSFTRKFWSFTCKQNWFPYQRLRTRTRFETEAKGDSEIASGDLVGSSSNKWRVKNECSARVSRRFFLERDFRDSKKKKVSTLNWNLCPWISTQYCITVHVMAACAAATFVWRAPTGRSCASGMASWPRSRVYGHCKMRTIFSLVPSMAR